MALIRTTPFRTAVSILVILCFCAIPPANGIISCYVCSSRSEPNCGIADRVSNYYHDCGLTQDRCMKVTGPGDFVSRSCAGAGTPGAEGCIVNGVIKTCTCYSNLCNSGKRFGLSWSLGLFPLMYFAGKAMRNS